MIKKLKPYLFNALFVSIFFTGLAIIFQFTPFGKDTMLTVDLGQQYIDFYSMYKETLTQSPEMLLYSFEKALGGEMLGLWAYYLLSPFNLIFLFFNESNFEVAVTLITYLKLLTSSLTFMYFSRQKYALKTIPANIFSLSYTFMSYTIVYQLNIMWLDGLILLPLIALGLDRLISSKGRVLYVFSLAVLLIANYYIGYMICIFLALYALYVIIEKQTTFNIKDTVISYFKFGIHSIIAALIAGIALVPTYYSLTQNKGSYLELELDWEVAHTIQDVASKLFVGSFNFDEMSSGSPNIYAGMLVLFFAGLFFINKKIKLSEKLVAVFIIGFFALSFRYDLLNKLWHGGQFPIWYHFRFSFTTSFFIIIMAIKAFKYQPKRFSLGVLITAIIGMAIFSGYYLWINEYTFLNDINIFISLAFFLAFVIIIQLERPAKLIRYSILFIFVFAEMFINAYIIMSDINYVQQSKFEDYTEILDQSLSGLRHSDTDFYRISKTFMRTKNEAMYTHYSGMDHFGSTIEAHVPELYGYLGQPDGNGFATYTNGTLFLDDFFNIRYFLDSTDNTDEHTDEDGYVLYPEATDLDIDFHPVMSQFSRVKVYENERYFGLGIEVSPDIVNEESSFSSHRPIENQELLLSLIDYNGIEEPYFTEHEFTDVTYENVEVTDTGDGDYYTYKDTSESDAQTPRIRWHFDTTSTNPYYFSIPSQFSSKNVSLDLNSNHYRFYSPFRRRQIYNASYNTIREDQYFDVELEEEELQSNLLELYEFDLERYENMMDTKQDNQFNVTQSSHNRIKGNINIEQDEAYLLFTIPYDAAWNINVDGQDVQPVSVLNDTLMAIPLTNGQHTIDLHYFPRSIVFGSILSIIGFTSLLGVIYIDRKKESKNKQNYSKTQA